MRMHAVLTVLVLLASLALAGDAKPKDWSAHMGDVAFVVGMDAGRKEVEFTGRPAMLFFTSSHDEWCPKFAARTWKDRQVLSDIEGYTPVLIDAEEAGKAFCEKYNAVMLPAVVWLDFDESQVFMLVGDADLGMFRVAGSGIAKARCPDAHPAAAGMTALLESKKKLDAAATAKDVKAQLAAIAEIRGVGLGAAVQKAAAAADARLTKDGETEIERAMGLATAKKKPDAKKALEKLVADYGAEHPVGRKAKIALDELAGKVKPKK